MAVAIRTRRLIIDAEQCRTLPARVGNNPGKINFYAKRSPAEPLRHGLNAGIGGISRQNGRKLLGGGGEQ